MSLASCLKGLKKAKPAGQILYSDGMKRLFDICVSAGMILLTSPLWLMAAVGIKLTSPGPVFYPAKRVGKDGRLFSMHKFRTMHWRPQYVGAAITGRNDSRIFGFGAFLRKSKIDELPQFLDVLKGDMSIVGPRPEDPGVVERDYTDWMKETLKVKPGITSPGAIWGYTCAEALMTGDNPEKDYAEKVLPYKLALEYVYTQRQSMTYDLQLVFRTAAVIPRIVLGKKNFPDLPENDMIPPELPKLTKRI